MEEQGLTVKASKDCKRSFSEDQAIKVKLKRKGRILAQTRDEWCWEGPVLGDQS